MKVDLTQIISKADGTPFMFGGYEKMLESGNTSHIGGQPMTLGIMVTEALTNAVASDKEKTGVEKRTPAAIWSKKIFGEKMNAIELDESDIKIIQERIDEFWTQPLMLLKASEMIEAITK